MKGNFVTAASKQSRGAEDPKQQQMRNMKKKTAIRKCDAGFFDKSWQESGDASALYLNCLTDITYYRHGIRVETEPQTLAHDDDEEEDDEEEEDVELVGEHDGESPAEVLVDDDTQDDDLVVVASSTQGKGSFFLCVPVKCSRCNGLLQHREQKKEAKKVSNGSQFRLDYTAKP